MGFYILYIIGFTLANILPLRLAYWVSERFADAHYSISRKDREAVAKNLSIVLKKDMRESLFLARKVFRNFAMYLVDFFRIGRLNKDAVEKRVRVLGLENLNGALRQNNGAIALSAHIGNWEMGGVVTAIIGYDISAVVLIHKHRKINEFFIGQREKKGMKAIPIDSIMRRCTSALSRNGMLALVGDRDFTNSGIILDFFGVPTSIPKGPAIFSLRIGSPIVPTFFIREDRFNYKLIFDKPIERELTQGVEKDEMVERLTKKFIPIMEKYIREYPEQWLMFRRFWETPKDAFVI